MSSDKFFPNSPFNKDSFWYDKTINNKIMVNLEWNPPNTGKENDPNKDDDRPQSESLRNFLKLGSLGMVAVGLGVEKAEAEPRTLESEIKELGWEGSPEDAPGIGVCRRETLLSTLCIAPRNEKESGQFQAFMDFIYGGYPPGTVVGGNGSLRSRMVAFLNMELAKAGISPEEFDRVAHDAVKSYMNDGMGVSLRVSKNSPGGANESIYNPLTKEVKIVVPSERPLITSGLQPIALSPVLHEDNHATQDQGVDRGLFGFQKNPLTSYELPVITEGPIMIKVLEMARREKRLDPKGYEDLITTFPSGEKCKLSELMILVEGFIVNEGEKHSPIVSNFAKPEAIRLLNRLIYGSENANRSDILLQQLEAAENTFDTETRQFAEDRVRTLFGYASEAAEKQFPNDRTEQDKTRKLYFQRISASFDKTKEISTAQEGEEEFDELHRELLSILGRGDQIYQFDVQEFEGMSSPGLIRRTGMVAFLEVIEKQHPEIHKYWSENGLTKYASRKKIYFQN
jgi:hypothetical protein